MEQLLEAVAQRLRPCVLHLIEAYAGMEEDTSDEQAGALLYIVSMIAAGVSDAEVEEYVERSTRAVIKMGSDER